MRNAIITQNDRESRINLQSIISDFSKSAQGFRYRIGLYDLSLEEMKAEAEYWVEQAELAYMEEQAEVFYQEMQKDDLMPNEFDVIQDNLERV